jgi:hypothetical protein
MMSHKTLYGLLGLLLISPLSPARDRPFVDEPEETLGSDIVEKTWKEGEVSLPERYQEKNLQAFRIGERSNFRYFIDRESLQTSEDGVTRFILVIRSRSGVDNSSYEGIRCGQREYRVYAYGGPKGFKRIPGSDWRHIPKSGRENYRNYLYQDLICNTYTGKPNSPGVVIDAMRRNIEIRSTPFFQD